MKRLTEQERDHEEELRKISQKMEKIKLRNRRLGGVSKDDWLHYDGVYNSQSVAMCWGFSISLHSAICCVTLSAVRLEHKEPVIPGGR